MVQLIGSVPLTLAAPAMDWRRFPELVQSDWFANKEESRVVNYRSSEHGIRNNRTQAGQRERREKRARRAQPQACISASKALRQQPRYNWHKYTVTQVSLCSKAISIPAPLFGPRLPVKPHLSAVGGFQVHRMFWILSNKIMKHITVRGGPVLIRFV